jgi:glycosyltransferase involved in cell wall biosynthesis
VKPVVLVLIDWYLPGYKAGGSVTAVSNLIELVGDEFEFRVFTRDRDRTDQHPYSNLELNRWTNLGKAQVFYASEISLPGLRHCVQEVSPDVIYLNSFFSRLTIGILLLRLLGLLPHAGVVVAPRGEFSPGALALKRWRKLCYRTAAFAAGLYRGVLWQASSQMEEGQIRAVAARSGSSGDIQLASDIPTPGFFRPRAGRRPAKIPGALQLIFLSRISRKKNLLFALLLLAATQGEIQLDIYGPIDDPAYWKACAKQISRLPNSIHVRYQGAVAPDRVLDVFTKYHFQLLPTLGENFGYTILEGFAAGCPVVLSDLTPWREATDGGAGWSLPLEDRELWQQVLQQCVDMDQAAYLEFSQNARHFVEAWAKSHNQKDETVHLFNLALEREVSFGR